MPINRFFRGALACAFAFAGFAAVENARAQQCKPEEAALSDARATLAVVEGSRLNLLVGDSAARFMKALNAEPPVSELHAEKIIAVEFPDKNVVTAYFVVDGCTRLAYVRMEVWKRLVTAASGDPS